MRSTDTGNRQRGYNGKVKFAGLLHDLFLENDHTKCIGRKFIREGEKIGRGNTLSY